VRKEEGAGSPIEATIKHQRKRRALEEWEKETTTGQQCREIDVERAMSVLGGEGKGANNGTEGQKGKEETQGVKKGPFGARRRAKGLLALESWFK